MGLLELSTSFPDINFALLKSQNYDIIQFQTVAFHRGKKSGLMHVVAEGGGGKRRPFCRRKTVKSFHAHTHNMQKPQDNAADSVGLMSQVTESAAFCFIQRKDTSEEMPFLEDR